MTELIRWFPIAPAGLEIRAGGDDGPGVVAGPLMVYGDQAMVYGAPERMEPGVFGDVHGADVIARYMHDRRQPLARSGVEGPGGLTLADGAERLDVEIRMPDTQRGRDAMTEVRAGVLRGLSVEFMPVAWRAENDVIIFTRARLLGLGLVDIPAYPQSVPSARWIPPAGQRQRRRRLWL